MKFSIWVFLLLIISAFNNEAIATDYDSKIDDYALFPYDTKNYPKTVAKYGSRLKEIEILRRQAAEIAIDSGRCDFVWLVEISDNRSTLNHLEFFIDCKNGNRIRMNEFDIKERKQARTESEKAWDESSARQACRDLINNLSLSPNSIDIHDIFGVSFRKADITHNVIITMNFDVKNIYDKKIKYTAKCYFKPGVLLGTVEIYNR